MTTRRDTPPALRVVARGVRSVAPTSHLAADVPRPVPSPDSPSRAGRGPLPLAPRTGRVDDNAPAGRRRP